MDLSVLDVLQVFGRAGRPGLESSGEGYICTTEDKLTHYLDAVASQVSKLVTTAVNEYTDENSQNPIESQSVVVPLICSRILIIGRFQLGMVDALNAEIALGTVATVAEGVRWLGYTYLFVRMCKNPMQYGKGNFEN